MHFCLIQKPKLIFQTQLLKEVTIPDQVTKTDKNFWIPGFRSFWTLHDFIIWKYKLKSVKFAEFS